MYVFTTLTIHNYAQTWNALHLITNFLSGFGLLDICVDLAPKEESLCKSLKMLFDTLRHNRGWLQYFEIVCFCVVIL